MEFHLLPCQIILLCWVQPQGIRLRKWQYLRNQNEQQEKFPNDPIFNRLLSVAWEFRGTVVYDTTVGIEVDYARFFNDVSRQRATLRRELPQSVSNEHGLVDGGSPFINVLPAGGYEFIVGLYTILSIGAACVPLGKYINTSATVYVSYPKKILLI